MMPRLPWRAFDRACRLIVEQAPLHPGQDWRDEPADSHLAAARRHLAAIERGDLLDESGHPHLLHAMTRLLMTVDVGS